MKLVLIVIFCASIISAEAYLSNIEIIGQLIEEKYSLITSFLSGYQGKTLNLQIEGTHEANDIVLSYFQSVLSKFGQPYRVVTSKNGASGLALNVKILDLGVIYDNVRRKMFVGSHVIDRSSKITLFLSLIDTDGKILSSTKLANQKEDTIPLDNALLYQNPAYKFSSPKIPESRSSILEPIVVTGIVGTLIYIFYANKEK